MNETDFSVTVLGCGGALYEHQRHPSAQLLQMGHHKFLIDCGEGTQFQLKNFGLSPFPIKEIFITHLHGDHYFGLIGLLSSMSLQGRSKPLTVFSPKGLKAVILPQLDIMQKDLSFSLRFVEVPTEGASRCIFETDELSVWNLPLKHRVPVSGYIFREKQRERKMLKEKIQEYGLSIAQIKAVKRGEDLIIGGEKIGVEELSLPTPPPRSFAYCSDTLYLPHLAKALEGIHLIYHESTFTTEREDKALRSMHSTAAQAAAIARDAGAQALLLGHFSGRYADLTPFLEEAQAVFPRTYLAEEGKRYEVPGVPQNAMDS